MNIRARIENLIMTCLVPLDGPGTIMRWLFRLPLFFNRLGLTVLIPKHVLILTTTGRKTGKPRQTALEYWGEPDSDAYRVMAGWAGKTDWFRNACAKPQVTVQIGRQVFDALAEPVSEEDVTQTLLETTRLNPGALKIWSRWAGRPLDNTEASLRRAAPYFPMLKLRPRG